ncbi:MAG: hypothetical protein ACRD3C_24190 [Vicinamibacterales bacterium]
MSEIIDTQWDILSLTARVQEAACRNSFNIGVLLVHVASHSFFGVIALVRLKPDTTYASTGHRATETQS